MTFGLDRIFDRSPGVQFGPKIAKIDDFPKNAPNHPDFAPGKFGGQTPGEMGRFGSWEPKILYMTPL